MQTIFYGFFTDPMVTAESEQISKYRLYRNNISNKYFLSCRTVMVCYNVLGRALCEYNLLWTLYRSHGHDTISKEPQISAIGLCYIYLCNDNVMILNLKKDSFQMSKCCEVCIGIMIAQELHISKYFFQLFLELSSSTLYSSREQSSMRKLNILRVLYVN